MKNKSKKEVKALSIIQPWATCITCKGKNIENRSWNTNYRGYIAIHASIKKDLERFEQCKDLYNVTLNPDRVSYGAIVGFAEIVDVVTDETLTRGTEKWFMGEFGFVLKNRIALKNPIPAKGSLSFWTIPPKVLKEALAQLSATQRNKILSNLLHKLDV